MRPSRETATPTAPARSVTFAPPAAAAFRSDTSTVDLEAPADRSGSHTPVSTPRSQQAAKAANPFSLVSDNGRDDYAAIPFAQNRQQRSAYPHTTGSAIPMAKLAGANGAPRKPVSKVGFSAGTFGLPKDFTVGPEGSHEQRRKKTLLAAAESADSIPFSAPSPPPRWRHRLSPIALFRVGGRCVQFAWRCRRAAMAALTGVEQRTALSIFAKTTRAGAVTTTAGVRTLLLAAGQTLDDDELRDVLGRAEYRDGETLTVEVYMRLLQVQKRKFNLLLRTTDTEAAFKALADPETNDIAVPHLLSLCHAFSLSRDVEDFIHDADADGGGRIDFSEFHELLDDTGAADQDKSIRRRSSGNSSVAPRAAMPERRPTALFDQSMFAEQSQAPTHHAASPSPSRYTAGFTTAALSPEMSPARRIDAGVDVTPERYFRMEGHYSLSPTTATRRGRTAPVATPRPRLVYPSPPPSMMRKSMLESGDVDSPGFFAVPPAPPLAQIRSEPEVVVRTPPPSTPAPGVRGEPTLTKHQARFLRSGSVMKFLPTAFSVQHAASVVQQLEAQEAAAQARDATERQADKLRAPTLLPGRFGTIAPAGSVATPRSPKLATASKSPRPARGRGGAAPGATAAAVGVTDDVDEALRLTVSSAETRRLQAIRDERLREKKRRARLGLLGRTDPAKFRRGGPTGCGIFETEKRSETKAKEQRLARFGRAHLLVKLHAAAIVAQFHDPPTALATGPTKHKYSHDVTFGAAPPPVGGTVHERAVSATAAIPKSAVDWRLPHRMEEEQERQRATAERLGAPSARMRQEKKKKSRNTVGFGGSSSRFGDSVDKAPVVPAAKATYGGPIRRRLHVADLPWRERVAVMNGVVPNPTSANEDLPSPTPRGSSTAEPPLLLTPRSVRSGSGSSRQRPAELSAEYGSPPPPPVMNARHHNSAHASFAATQRRSIPGAAPGTPRTPQTPRDHADHELDPAKYPHPSEVASGVGAAGAYGRPFRFSSVLNAVASSPTATAVSAPRTRVSVAPSSPTGVPLVSAANAKVWDGTVSVSPPRRSVLQGTRRPRKVLSTGKKRSSRQRFKDVESELVNLRTRSDNLPTALFGPSWGRDGTAPSASAAQPLVTAVEAAAAVRAQLSRDGASLARPGTASEREASAEATEKARRRVPKGTVVAPTDNAVAKANPQYLRRGPYSHTDISVTPKTIRELQTRDEAAGSAARQRLDDITAVTSPGRVRSDDTERHSDVDDDHHVNAHQDGDRAVSAAPVATETSGYESIARDDGAGDVDAFPSPVRRLSSGPSSSSSSSSSASTTKSGVSSTTASVSRQSHDGGGGEKGRSGSIAVSSSSAPASPEAAAQSTGALHPGTESKAAVAGDGIGGVPDPDIEATPELSSPLRPATAPEPMGGGPQQHLSRQPSRPSTGRERPNGRLAEARSPDVVMQTPHQLPPQPPSPRGQRPQSSSLRQSRPGSSRPRSSVSIHPVHTPGPRAPSTATSRPGSGAARPMGSVNCAFRIGAAVAAAPTQHHQADVQDQPPPLSTARPKTGDPRNHRQRAGSARRPASSGGSSHRSGAAQPHPREQREVRYVPTPPSGGTHSLPSSSRVASATAARPQTVPTPQRPSRGAAMEERRASVSEGGARKERAPAPLAVSDLDGGGASRIPGSAEESPRPPGRRGGERSPQSTPQSQRKATPAAGDERSEASLGAARAVVVGDDRAPVPEWATFNPFGISAVDP